MTKIVYDSCLRLGYIVFQKSLDSIVFASPENWVSFPSKPRLFPQRTKIVFDRNLYCVINLLTFVVYLHNLDDSIFPCILYFTLQVLLTSIPTRFPNATHTLVKQRHGQNGFTCGIILLVGHCQILVITNLSRKGEKIDIIIPARRILDKYTALVAFFKN